jgi:probable F420-dependent oxidoreductase
MTATPTTRPPSLSVTLTNYGTLFEDPADWHRLTDLAKMAEEAGVDRILLTDHVVMGKRTDAYPWGPFPFPPELPWLEPLSVISAMAAVTSRIRFSTKILIAPLRPAPLLAKTLATMDVLSRGRMEIGVSTGWQREEYEASGVEWDRRGQLLTDTMAACRVLWRDAPASFTSESFSFEDVWCRPKPLQEGGIPIWFAGGLHPRNIDRLCRLGDGWIPAPYCPIDVFRELVRCRARRAWPPRSRQEPRGATRLARGRRDDRQCRDVPLRGLPPGPDVLRDRGTNVVRSDGFVPRRRSNRMTAVPLYDPSSEEVIRDPYPSYRRLRDEAPAYFVESWNTWALSRFEDIWKVTQDNTHLSTREGTVPAYLVTKQIEPAPNLNHMDPPEQKALRSDLMPFFLPAHVRSLERRVRSIVNEALDSLVETGRADALGEIGQIVSTRVACEAIGFPSEDQDYIVDLVKRFFAEARGVEPEAGQQISAFDEMKRYLESVARERRAYTGPPENPIDVLLRSKAVGPAASDELVGGHMIPLLAGGTETFPKVFAAAVYRLWQHPDQRRELVNDPTLIPDAFRECLRFDMPTQMAMRKVVQEFQIHDETLRPGESLMFLWPSGNHDEREFPDPDRFDIRRRARRFLSFGNGIHRCVGANVAELEGRILLEEFLRRAPEYEVEEGGVEREPSDFFHAFSAMPIHCAWKGDQNG